MKLIVDLGNTLKKFAVFDQKNCLEVHSLQTIDLVPIQQFVIRYPSITHCILSSVIDYPAELTTFLSQQFQFIKLDHNTPIPIKNNYLSKETLGNDRLSAAIGGNSIFPNKNILVIQAGTCLTYEFVNEQNEYIGGSISPGINMRFQALNTFTGKLPLISQNENNCLTGQTTEHAILSGVQQGIIAETDGIINLYKQKYNNLTIIMSGGDANFFGKRLKNSIFAVSNIVLTGLNEILDFNVR